MKKRAIPILLAVSLTMSAVTISPMAAETQDASQLSGSENLTQQSDIISNMDGARDVVHASSPSPASASIVSANIMDVNFLDGTPADTSPTENLCNIYGNPSITYSEELHKSVAAFDGKSAYLYPFDTTKYSKIQSAVSIECMFKYNSIPSSGEYDIFSNQQSGGIGLGLENGRLNFYAHVGGSYRQPKTDIKPGQWVHAIGVVDGTSVKLYLNGLLADEIRASGPVKYSTNTGAYNFVIGGDSSPNNGAEFLSNGVVSLARLYDTALNADQITNLYHQAFQNTDIPEPQPQKVNLGIVTSDTAAADSQLNISLHAGAEQPGTVNRISYDVLYDSSVLAYEGVQHKMSGVAIDSSQEGRLQITSSAPLATDDFRQFGTTRLGKLNFRTKSVLEVSDTTLTIQNYHAYADNTDVTDVTDTQEISRQIRIFPKNALDYNGDGVVGAGDVALAPSDMKSTVAQESSIYPYKHAIVLTVDGGGQAWNPDEIYYTTANSILPRKTSDPEILSKRTNDYAMKLFNEEFATSYTAQAVFPSISGQNYSSMIHGVQWGEADFEYQLTNDTAGREYYADFGKDSPRYPSMFKAVTQATPERPMAAFAEWSPILNGIIEPDAAVIGKNSVAKKSFYDVADYIQSSEYQNTALVYMQSDQMDNVGHGTGYYNNNYWAQLKQYDDYYRAVVDALKETGTYEETLIVSNADHGGSGTSHGSSDPSNMDIFIGMGGQTVDSGRKLSGGNNADIAAIALAGLRVEKPDSMTGDVFDQSAFLAQTAMSKKNRDIEKVSFERNGKTGTLKLTNQKSQTRSIDALIQIGNAKVTNIDPKGGTILRNEVEDGQLKLTISYKEQPSELAKITFDKDTMNNIEVTEIMLGTQDGKERYCDLTNETGTPSASLDTLKSKIDAASALKASTYTKASWSILETALKEAKIAVETEGISQEAVNAAADKLSVAISSLVKAADKTSLNKEIAAAASIKKGTYTDASWNEFQTALDNAKAVLAKDTATQGETDASAKALASAVQNLALKKPVAGTSFTVNNLNYKVVSATKAAVTGIRKGTKAKSLTIPSSVKYLNTSLKVSAINASAFKNNKRVQSITIGKNIVTIGKNAFQNCTSLKKVTIKSTQLAAIGEKAFRKCTSLTKINLPGSLKTIGAQAFYGDKKLQSVQFHSKSLTKVGANAFQGISAKAVIKVPKTKMAAYKKILKNKGLTCKMKIRGFK